MDTTRVASHAINSLRSEELAKPSLRRRAEYWAARGVFLVLGAIPHRAARAMCSVLALWSYAFWPRLRRTGDFNLALAFPEWSRRERRRVLYGVFQNLGRMLADFAHFPRWNRANIARQIDYDGFEHFELAQKRGNGVLFLTAHFGNWELGSFAHGAFGYPVNFVARKLDNPLIDALINRYRCLSGGEAIDKDEFARPALRALGQNESVGILMDQNMMASEGVFVEFFGRPASTTAAPARVAQKTGAAVVLGLVIWDEPRRKYRLRFESVEWIRCEDPAEEVQVNTQNFTRRLERYIRQYPSQWLWVHRRWKTRPPGEPPLYPF
ncbi:MAG: lysophospholipid acyltransferase family protein [Terriglobia bacterium]